VKLGLLLGCFSLLLTSGLLVGNYYLRADDRVIDALDRAVQERFADVNDGRFGITRVTHPSPEAPRRFEPNSAEERRLIRDLRAAGRDVVLIVVGHTARTIRPLGNAATQRYAQRYYADTGPAFRTELMPIALRRAAPRVKPPTEEELGAQVTAAFAAFRSTSTYKFRSGEWSITARPIRASRAQCLSCHLAPATEPALKIGDPLGIALYALTPSASPGRAH
jgi:hypothetical protein